MITFEKCVGSGNICSGKGEPKSCFLFKGRFLNNSVLSVLLKSNIYLELTSYEWEEWKLKHNAVDLMNNEFPKL